MKNNTDIKLLLEESRIKLNKLIEENGGQMTQEIIDVSQQLDKIIVQIMKSNNKK